MYEVRVQAQFPASHQLCMYDGQWEPIHAHDWLVEARFAGPDLDAVGVLIDFTAVQHAMEACLAPLRDTRLNDTPLLEGLNPSAEHLARRIFEALDATLGPGSPLTAVQVREAPGCYAIYHRPCGG